MTTRQVLPETTSTYSTFCPLSATYADCGSCCCCADCCAFEDCELLLGFSQRTGPKASLMKGPGCSSSERRGQSSTRKSSSSVAAVFLARQRSFFFEKA